MVTSGDTVITAPFEPLFQEYDVPPEALSVVLWPCVMVTLLNALEVGFGFTTTFTVAVCVHHAASVIVQVCIPVDKPVVVAVAAAVGLHK